MPALAQANLEDDLTKQISTIKGSNATDLQKRTELALTKCEDNYACALALMQHEEFQTMFRVTKEQADTCVCRDSGKTNVGMSWYKLNVYVLDNDDFSAKQGDCTNMGRPTAQQSCVAGPR
ncbi:hypothetical protein KOW79_017571 [Hemibagrus wyckioides]|uniref:Uncharacterized protein n=1 Tax=Hemibagrus wyckioides TaxID=337641 RepID=A0A9D3NDW1_9TELE|nr:hypothetical protein KOW79_017571 [Hemibagrus wyckioides]